MTEVTLGVGASFFLRHALDRTKEGMEPTKEENGVGWKVLGTFLDLHGGSWPWDGKGKETHSFLTLPTLESKRA